MPEFAILWDHEPPPHVAATPALDAFSEGWRLDLDAQAGALSFGRASAPVQFVCAAIPTFSEDFYDRLHFSTLEVDLGDVVGEQTRELLVWNAHRRARILESTSLASADGITLSGQPPAPLQFAPLQERAYSIQANSDGPAAIAATATFDFDDGTIVVVAIVGSRVTAWSWAPNWADSMLERLEWMTDILTAYRGEEQARSIRLLPRQVAEFSVFADTGPERRALEATVWDWGARVWAVPLWWDGVDLSAPIPAGSTSVSLQTAGRDFRAGTLGMLLGASSREYEIVEIASVSSGSVALVRPTLSAWPVGARIYPARTAWIDGEASFSRFTTSTAYCRLRFEMVEPADYPAAHAAANYRGFPVMEQRPSWPLGEDPTLTMERKLDVFDPGVGIVSIVDEAGMPASSQQLRWTLENRTEYDQYRKRLFALRGRQGRIWIPTWAEDVAVIATVASTATTIDVSWFGYTKRLQLKPNRKDIRIELRSGAVLYRRITGSVEVDANTERFTIDSALGVTVSPSDILMVSFLALCRMNSDAAEFAWFTGDIVETGATFRGARHDV